MCSLVEILPKVGHVKLEEIQRLWEEGRHFASGVIFYYFWWVEWLWIKWVCLLMHPWYIMVWEITRKMAFFMVLVSCLTFGKWWWGGCYGFFTTEVTPGITFSLGTISVRHHQQWFTLIWRYHAKNLDLKWDRPVASSGFARNLGQRPLLWDTVSSSKKQTNEQTKTMITVERTVPINHIVQLLSNKL